VVVPPIVWNKVFVLPRVLEFPSGRNEVESVVADVTVTPSSAVVPQVPAESFISAVKAFPAVESVPEIVNVAF